MLLQEQTWLSVSQLSKEMPVIIPIAALEQHGHHLPLFTDSMLLGEIVRRVELKMADQALFAPLTWLGNSHHHLDYAGTLSAPPKTYIEGIVGLVDNFIHHGFHRIFVLNGHGGNDVPGKQAIFELRQTYRSRKDLLLLFSTYWSLGGKPHESMTGFVQVEMGHACEWETSMMLCIAPQLVGDFKSVIPVEQGNPFGPASRAWVTQDRSDVGHIGYPGAASKEKGEHLLATFANDVQRTIGQMIDWNGQTW